MALFKIEKGLKANLASKRPNTVEGYCYLTTDDGKFYIDIATGTGTATDTTKRIVLNAGSADKLTVNGGSEHIPVYFKNGVPVAVSHNLNTMKEDIGEAIVSLSANGTTISYTNNNGETESITTQDTTYSAATQSAAGLMSAEDKKKLDGIASGATANKGDITGVTAGNGLTGGATSGTATLNVGAGAGISVTADAVALATSGVEKGTYGPTQDISGAEGNTILVPQVTVDEYGRVTSIVNRTYTSKNTTYSEASESASGLISAADKKKLNGIESGAQVNKIETVKVNNTALSISNKTVNIDLSAYATAAQGAKADSAV